VSKNSQPEVKVPNIIFIVAQCTKALKAYGALHTCRPIQTSSQPFITHFEMPNQKRGFYISPNWAGENRMARYGSARALILKLKKSPCKNRGFCGEIGIRTLGTSQYTRFPVVHLRPLGHLSW
jgi:hypothetical protein